MTNRSKSLFGEAFLCLSERKGIDDITVTEVAKESGLTRRTFYRHYTGIADLARQSMRALGRSFANGLSQADVLTPQAYSRSIFAFWDANFALLENICRSQNASTLLTEWMEGAGAAVHHVDPKSVDGNCAAKYLMRFMTGGLVATLLTWVADEDRPAPATMARIVSFPMRNAE